MRGLWGEEMSFFDIFSKKAEAPVASRHELGTIPTVKFDKANVTAEVIADLRANVDSLPEVSSTNFQAIYNAALRGISAGSDLSIIFNAVMEAKIEGMTKRRASQIALLINKKSSALMTKNKCLSIGITEAKWLYSGAPCSEVNSKDRRQDEAHKAANGKIYKIKKGLFINGKWTYPGWDEGCGCVAIPVIEGFG